MGSKFNGPIQEELHHAAESLTNFTQKITPRPNKINIQDGYLYLNKKWVHENPKFRFSCPMQARIVRPHPLTMQRIAYITRGPIVYCVEDIDHPWEQDHFKVK